MEDQNNVLQDILQQAQKEAVDEIEEELVKKNDILRLEKLREIKKQLSGLDTIKIGGISS